MATKLFFTPEKLREETIVDTNTDNKRIEIAIKNAQLLDLEPCLGSPLYLELETAVKDENLTVNQIALLNVIFPFLLNASVLNIIKETLARISNGGLNTSINSDNSTDRKDVDYQAQAKLEKAIKNDKDGYLIRLKDYLDKNAELFPLYSIENDSSLADNIPNEFEHAGGFWFDDEEGIV